MSIRTLSIVFVATISLCGIRSTAQTALDLDGRATSPFEAGRVAVLIFVRTDCPVSNRYAPEIRRLAEEFQGRAVFWLIYPDRKESAQTVQKHLDEFGYRLPALRDLQHELVRKAGAKITPEAAVFYGSELRYLGRIDDRAIDFGTFRPAATTRDLENAVQAVIAGRAAHPASRDPVGCYISDLE